MCNGYHCDSSLRDLRHCYFRSIPLCFLVSSLRVVSIIFHSVYDTRVRYKSTIWKDRRIVAIYRALKRGERYVVLFIFLLDQLPTVVFSNARFVMLMVVCIVKRAGMRPTCASVKIVSFSLEFCSNLVLSIIVFSVFTEFQVLKNKREKLDA